MKQKHKLTIRHNCGFFSDLLTTVAGIMYCHDNNLDFHVDWRNSHYNFNNECNLFDKYFYQNSKNDSDCVFEHHTRTPYGYYFHAMHNFNNREIVDFLRPASYLIKEYDLLNNENFNNVNFEIFNNKKILGVHRRGTDHFNHGILLSDEYVLNEINEEFKKNSYDKIFLITDDINSFNFFEREIGNDLITTNSIKTNSRLGVHRQGGIDGHKLATDIITDSYLLSKTSFKLITRSNVSTFSLLCNLNEHNFKYIDNHITYR